MAYTVTITEIGSDVTVNESSYAVDVTTNTYPVTVSYDSITIEGPQGPAGPTGPTGATGPAGADGVDGVDGEDGTGADGVSVVDADVVSGNLVLTLSDASTIDSGTLPTTATSYTITDGTTTQTINDGDTMTLSGTANEIDVLVSATDTITVGLPDDVTITGNLTVNGTTTTLNTTTLDIEDKNITLAKDAADATAANGAGLTIDGADATLTYNSTGNVWAFDRNITVNGADVTSTKIGQWNTAYGWGDHSTEGYLTSYTETNDLTSAVTWATVPDAYISSSSVTQHQGNISITESQISDLSHTTSLPFSSITSTPTTLSGYGITDAATSAQGALADTALQSFTETNDLSTAVTWANVPNANITESSVTQHQAALSITESQISDLSHTTSLAFSAITATPTTLSGYGITDGYTDADVDTHLNTSTATTGQLLSWTGTDYDFIDPSVGGLNNVVEDTTPQLGGDLDLNTNDITGTGDIDITGVVTATEHVGLMNGATVFDAKAIGTDITKGEAVYISGISGNTPEVQLARANSSTTMPAFGFAQADIAQDATGKIAITGQIPGCDVADFAETGITFSLGDVLYVSAAEAGKLTNVAPSGESNFIQNLGKIERIAPTTNATILAMGAGRTNATPALNTGNIFYGVGNVSSTVNLDTTVASLGFIKGYTETNDLSTAVTWANVPDANITTSSVEQHEGNLSIGWSQVTSTPTTIAGYGITDNLQGTMTGNIDMSGNYFNDSSQTGTPEFTLAKSYTDPVSSVTTYVAQIDGGDLHIDQNKADPNLVYMKNPNTSAAATSEFRMENDNSFAFMSKVSSGYAQSYFQNIDPNELFFGNLSGEIVIATGGGEYIPGSTISNFTVKNGLGSAFGRKNGDSLRIDYTGETYFETGNVEINAGTLVIGKDYKETVYTSLPTSGTWSIDPDNGTVQEVTITGGITINAADQSALESGQTVTIVIKDANAGTLTSDLKWAGGNKTLSTTSGAIDIVTISNLNGTYYASLAKGFA